MNDSHKYYEKLTITHRSYPLQFPNMNQSVSSSKKFVVIDSSIIGSNYDYQKS